jgi:hypothetical protein
VRPPRLPPVARSVPSGLNATEAATAGRSGSGRLVISLPVAVSHRLVNPLLSPAARIAPSGLNATELT